MPKITKSLLILAAFAAGCVAASANAAVKGEKSTATGDTLKVQGQNTAPAGTPTYEIQQIEVKMDAYKTGDNVTAEDRANNAKIKRDILNGTFDLRELSQLALDKHWTGLSAAERSNFVSLMTTLLETKAIFSKEHTKTQGKAYIVKYLGDSYSDNKTKAKTMTKVSVPSEDVKVDIEYKLKKDSSGWKVFDVIVDDASLVENYRYQFDTIITKHGYAELVRRMQKKLAEIKTSSK